MPLRKFYFQIREMSKRYVITMAAIGCKLLALKTLISNEWNVFLLASSCRIWNHGNIRAESREERRILPFVACGTLFSDKGKSRLSRL